MNYPKYPEPELDPFNAPWRVTVSGDPREVHLIVREGAVELDADDIDRLTAALGAARDVIAADEPSLCGAYASEAHERNGRRFDDLGCAIPAGHGVSAIGLGAVEAHLGVEAAAELREEFEAKGLNVEEHLITVYPAADGTVRIDHHRMKEPSEAA